MSGIITLYDGGIRNTALSHRLLLPPFLKVCTVDYPEKVGTRVMHAHSSFQIIAVHSGSMTFGVGGRDILLSPGDFLLIPARVRHNWFIHEKSRTLQLLLSPILPEQYGELGMLQTMGNRQYRLAHTSADAVARCIQSVRNEEDDLRPGANLLVSAALLILMSELLRALHRSGDRVGCIPESVRKALLYIQNGNHWKITLAGLAKIAGVSQSRFSELFRLHTGYSPLDYVIRDRMERAKVMLLSSDLRLYEIVEHFGFESASYFSRKFKQLHGCSPSALRKHEYGPVG